MCLSLKEVDSLQLMRPGNRPFSWKVYSKIDISARKQANFLATGLCPFSSGQDYVASLHPFLPDRITSLRSILSSLRDRITSLRFILSLRTGLPRFASSFPSGQDYVAGAPFSFALPRVILRQSKSTSCIRRTSFYAHQRPLREQALDGPLVHEKCTQQSLSAFALV